jgi:hypothetical protein
MVVAGAAVGVECLAAALAPEASQTFREPQAPRVIAAPLVRGVQVLVLRSEVPADPVVVLVLAVLLAQLHRMAREVRAVLLELPGPPDLRVRPGQPVHKGLL